MSLSPWPAATAVQSRAAAIARVRLAVIGNDSSSDLSDDRVGEVGEAAAALVERAAPAAPQAIRDEAVIRCAGYLLQADFATIDSETIGPRTVSYITNHAAAFRNSGAAGLLSPWRVRRAGLAG